MPAVGGGIPAEEEDPEETPPPPPEGVMADKAIDKGVVGDVTVGVVVVDDIFLEGLCPASPVLLLPLGRLKPPTPVDPGAVEGEATPPALVWAGTPIEDVSGPRTGRVSLFEVDEDIRAAHFSPFSMSCTPVFSTLVSIHTYVV